MSFGTVDRCLASGLFTAGVLAIIAIGGRQHRCLPAYYYYYCPGGGAGGIYGYCPPTTTISPPNAPPIVTAGPDRTSDEGETKNFSLGSFSDANGNGPWDVTVTWGDGSPAKTFIRSSAGALGQRRRRMAEAVRTRIR